MRILFTVLLSIAVFAEDRKLAAVEFFGIAPGDDLDEVRRVLPFQVGDVVVPRRIEDWKSAARKATSGVTKRETTDVAFVCCNDDGGGVAYIGLGGNTSAAASFRAKATGNIRLPSTIMKFDRELNEIWINNVMAGAKGDGGALQKKLAELRVLATKHEPLLRRAAAESSDYEHRAVAAFALGHGLEPTAARIAVLVAASNDSDATVRNNAVRGLIDWGAKEPAMIQPEVFLKLVQSGIWSDRNKGSWALHSLATKKDPKVLQSIRQDAGAMAGLREIAAWKWDGHARPAREILELVK